MASLNIYIYLITFENIIFIMKEVFILKFNPTNIQNVVRWLLYCLQRCKLKFFERNTETSERKFPRASIPDLSESELHIFSFIAWLYAQKLPLFL